MTNTIVCNKNFKSINDSFNLNNDFHIFAGPCAIENLEQLEKVAKSLVKNGINFIRAGAYKPRTCPNKFQGLGLDGLKMLDYVRKKYNLLAVSEIVDTRDIELGLQYTDVIQIGSRNMNNFSLLKELGKTRHPILLKRGMMSTVNEFLLAAEYIVKNGNENVIMCERGIRTFETSTRNTLDISCVALIKQNTSLPIIVDLSHSLGRKDIIKPIAKSVLALGADGIMIEVHPDPSVAKSDANQQLDLNEFNEFLGSI